MVLFNHRLSKLEALNPDIVTLLYFGLHSTCRCSLVCQVKILTLVLLAFAPLPGAFVPCYVNKKCKYDVDSKDSDDCSVEVTVPVGHPKGA